MSETLEQEVNHPHHYNSHESGIEPIEICRYLPGDLSNIWKYNTRYEDKGTSKKDLKKLIWYFNDYRKNFIDMNNCVTMNFTIPSSVFNLMDLVIEAEPVECIKEIFKQVSSICWNQGIVNPTLLDKTLDDVDKYAETFNA